jgi:DNA-binding CsgD family transcriptional regulator
MTVHSFVAPPVAEVQLTPRELAVLGQLADGRTAASIGRRLAMSERTVHKHLPIEVARTRRRRGGTW